MKRLLPLSLATLVWAHAAVAQPVPPSAPPAPVIVPPVAPATPPAAAAAADEVETIVPTGTVEIGYDPKVKRDPRGKPIGEKGKDSGTTTPPPVAAAPARPIPVPMRSDSQRLAPKPSAIPEATPDTH